VRRSSPEELIAAIKPIIDAFVARFHCFRSTCARRSIAISRPRRLPDQEIRGQVMLLEQLYEKRYQRPLMDKEDSLFRLLNQVRDSQPEFAETIVRLQRNYERQYRPGPRDALEALAERLRQNEVRERRLRRLHRDAARAVRRALRTRPTACPTSICANT
jgi:hypothetical protein